MKKFIAENYQPAILFLLTLSIASIFSVLGIDPHHQGIMFKPAFDVAHGQMLFRDTFTQYGALTTLFHAWALRIFGDYLIVIQIETAVFYGLISVCLWYLWRNILPRWLTIISVIIWLFLAPYFMWIFFPWSSVPALLFQILSLTLLLRSLREKNSFLLMLAGGIAVLVFWCRQPVGVFHCASLFFFLATTPLITGTRWKNAMKDCVFLSVGIIAASLPFFVWLALNGAIHDMYLQSIKAAFFFGIEANDMFHQSGNFFTGILMALFVNAYGKLTPQTSRLWILLPLVCLFLLAVLAARRYLNKKNIENELPLYGLLLVSLASWMQYYPFPGIRHCYWAATPMIGVFAYSIWQLARLVSAKKTVMQILLVCLILASVFGYDIGKRLSIGYMKIKMINTAFKEPKILQGMYESSFNARKYQNISASLNSAIRENSFHYLVNLSSDALYSTFIGPQNNFHPMYVGWGKYTNFIYPDFTKLSLEFINTNHPLILSYEGRNIPGWTCVAVFNVIDFAHRLDYVHQRRVALYRFTGSKEKL